MRLRDERIAFARMAQTRNDKIADLSQDGLDALAPPYSPQALKASLKARSPGSPFSIAMMARR
jgi:hypothetical protein